MSGDTPIKAESGDVGPVEGVVSTNPAAVVEIVDDTADIITEAVEATWGEAVRRLGGSPSNPLPLWTMLAARILSAVANGERDPQRLKRFALDGLNAQDGRSIDC